MTRAHGLLVALVALAAMHGPDAPAAVLTGRPPTELRALRPERLPRVGNLFVENRGQVDGAVAYYVKGRGRDVFFTPQGVTFALTRHGARCAVKLDFVDPTPGAVPEGGDPTATLVSYFKGPKAQWRTGLRTFREIVYRDLWPGIDVVYRAEADRVKTTYIVRPGADPARIRVRYRGAASIVVGSAGCIEVETPAGGFRAGPTKLVVEPNPFGSSRAKFRLKAVADLTGKVDPNGALDLRFTNPAVDGRCRVVLGRGAFRLGKVRGALVEPNLNVQRANAKFGGSRGDKVTIVLGPV